MHASFMPSINFVVNQWFMYVLEVYAEIYVKFLDRKSQIGANRSLSGAPSVSEVVGRAGCVEMTMRAKR